MEKGHRELSGNKEKPKWEGYYDGSWEAILYYQARTNPLKINERRHRWLREEGKCKKCRIGGEEVEETLKHVITECPWYDEIRN